MILSSESFLGGKTKLRPALFWYHEYLSSAHWQDLHRATLAHAAGRCQMCGEPKAELDAYHKNYGSIGQEQADDLWVLCEACAKSSGLHQWHSVVASLNDAPINSGPMPTPASQMPVDFVVAKAAESEQRPVGQTQPAYIRRASRANSRQEKAAQWGFVAIVSAMVLIILYLLFVVLPSTSSTGSAFSGNGSQPPGSAATTSPAVTDSAAAIALASQTPNEASALASPTANSLTGIATATATMVVASPTVADSLTHTTVASNLRSGPGTAYPIVAIVKKGASVTVQERLANRSWYSVTIDSTGAKGWLFAGALASWNGSSTVPIAAHVPPTPQP